MLIAHHIDFLGLADRFPDHLGEWVVLVDGEPDSFWTDLGNAFDAFYALPDRSSAMVEKVARDGDPVG